MADYNWKFDHLSASRQKQGGDPSEQSFKGDFETFVREAVQNSNDAAVERPAEVVFDLQELEGEELEKFKDALKWDDKLEDHLKAVADTGHMKKVNRFLERIEEEDRIRILNIEDRNCAGLTGHENNDDSNFTGLLKHKLFSNKGGDGESSGGTYGLGKSVYWRFSEISTVLFNSNLVETPQDHDSPRFMGRINLPSHTIVGDEGKFEYRGPGWLGKLGEVKINGEIRKRAESLWGQEALEVSQRLHTEHDDSTGTSITIVGFSEPTSGNRDAAEIVKDIEDSSIEHFWPAIHDKRDYLDIKIRDEGNSEKEVRITEDDDIYPFVQAWDAFLEDNCSKEFEDHGDIVSREIEIDLPDRSDGTETGKGKATLLIRKADPDSEKKHSGDVAMFRKPGMVVKYWSPSISVAAEAFHAVLVAGEARNPDNPSKEEKEMERFLKHAEPPAHDEWQSTQKLKENYKQGFKKTVEKELRNKIKNAIEEVVIPEVEDGERGPERLATKFSMSKKRGKTDRSKNVLHFENLGGSFYDQTWELYGSIENKDFKKGKWKVSIEAQVIGEDGKSYEKIDIATMSADQGNANVDDGVAKIEVDEGTRVVNFNGESVEIDEDMAEDEIEMKINGEVKE